MASLWIHLWIHSLCEMYNVLWGSKIVLPLTQLTQKNRLIVWSTNANYAFEGLNQEFTSAPILMHIDSMRRFILDADASDFALGSVLTQIGDDGQLQKFEAGEINYEIHDKELHAIVDYFQQ